MTRTLSLLSWLAVGCAPAEAPLAGPSPEAMSRLGDRWYLLTVDDRDCSTCGGFFVEAVNRTQTLCADGTPADTCHVDALALPVSTTADQQARFDLALAEGRLLVSARLVADSTTTDARVTLDVGDAREGLSGAAPAGAFVSVAETGRSCGPVPCEDLRERRLGGLSSRLVADLDFSGSTLTDEQVVAAWDAAADPRGLVVAGRRTTVDDGVGGTLAARTVTEAWVPLLP